MKDLKMSGLKVSVYAATAVTTRLLRVGSTRNRLPRLAETAFTSSIPPWNVVIMTRMESQDLPVDQQVVLVSAPLVEHPEISD